MVFFSGWIKKYYLFPPFFFKTFFCILNRLLKDVYPENHPFTSPIWFIINSFMPSNPKISYINIIYLNESLIHSVFDYRMVKRTFKHLGEKREYRDSHKGLVLLFKKNVNFFVLFYCWNFHDVSYCSYYLAVFSDNSSHVVFINKNFKSNNFSVRLFLYLYFISFFC